MSSIDWNEIWNTVISKSILKVVSVMASGILGGFVGLLKGKKVAVNAIERKNDIYQPLIDELEKYSGFNWNVREKVNAPFLQEVVNNSYKYGINNEIQNKCNDLLENINSYNNIDSINPNNRYVPIQPKAEMDSIVLGSAIALPVGTVFMNANARDKARYVVNEFGAIVKEGGGKIVMDGLTSKNGVMILRHLKKVAFKGKQHKTYFNPQYNFASNPYQKAETVESFC